MSTPQGSVLTPLLANIVLHEFDKYMVDVTLPENTRGKRRRTNPLYNALAAIRNPSKKYYWEATPEEPRCEKALEMMRTLPRMDPFDKDFRRAMYIRYADDFIVPFEGPKSETYKIREKIQTFSPPAPIRRLYIAFLKERGGKEKCGLDLNIEKTVITHMNEGFKFLGAKINTLANSDFRMKTKTVTGAPITMRAHVRTRVNMPTADSLEKLIKVGIAKRDKHGNIVAKPLTVMVNADHTTIVQFYNAKINGIINYYSFAANRVKGLNLI
ncbi:hypothetical protein RUND412_009593 [Rhizina undulata]